MLTFCNNYYVVYVENIQYLRYRIFIFLIIIDVIDWFATILSFLLKTHY